MVVFLSNISIGIEECEDPQPLQPFHAINSICARAKAHSKGLLILFKERDKYDLYGRKMVYWAITPELAQKLIRCAIDMKAEEEFNDAEITILQDLATKKWIKTIKNNGTTYYYGLNRKTTSALKNQLKIISKNKLR